MPPELCRTVVVELKSTSHISPRLGLEVLLLVVYDLAALDRIAFVDGVFIILP